MNIAVKKSFAIAFKNTLPVMAGYLVLGFGFGILMLEKGFGADVALAMSLFIYAGSMQYVAVGLLTSGAGLITTAFTTLLVNARHLFYGISMVDKYKKSGKKKPYLIFALTDETYSLVSNITVPNGINRHFYCFLVSVFDHFYWVLGTALGLIAGSVLPLNFKGIEFALTALFVTIFVEQWLSNKNHTPAIIGVLATAASLLLFGKDIFLIPSMVLIALLLVVLNKTKGGVADE